MARKRYGEPNQEEREKIFRDAKKLLNKHFLPHGIYVTYHPTQGLQFKIRSEDGMYPVYEGSPNLEIGEDIQQPQGLEKKMTSQDIKAYLDKYVVKQEEAKEILSTVIVSHYHKIERKPKPGEVEIKKKNVLLIGNTGVGKSYIIKKIAEKLDVPFAKVSATDYTAAGYVGGDVDDIVRKNLLGNANGNVEAAEKGIVYIDEFDKISASRGGHGPDVGGDKVQSALLTLIEGKELDTISSHDTAGLMERMKEEERTGRKQKRMINTKDILFIVGGSFSFSGGGSLVEIIKERKIKEKNEGAEASPFGLKSKIDYEGVDDYVYLKDITPHDLIAFGMRPEIVGRFTIITSLENLYKEDLVKILKDVENSLVDQYKEEFKGFGVEKLDFENDTLYAIAEKAAKLGTGARSLESIMSKILLKYMHNLENTGIKKLTITRKIIENPEKELKKILKKASEKANQIEVEQTPIQET